MKWYNLKQRRKKQKKKYEGDYKQMEPNTDVNRRMET